MSRIIRYTVQSLLLLVCITASVQGQAKNNAEPAKAAVVETSALYGKIIDKISGEELPGVAVRIKGTNLMCFTDFEGNFQFKNMKSGKYELEAEFISYKKAEKINVQIGANEVHELPIKMEQVQ
jgi:hypothetical protein